MTTIDSDVSLIEYTTRERAGVGWGGGGGGGRSTSCMNYINVVKIGRIRS